MLSKSLSPLGGGVVEFAVGPPGVVSKYRAFRGKLMTIKDDCFQVREAPVAV